MILVLTINYSYGNVYDFSTDNQLQLHVIHSIYFHIYLKKRLVWFMVFNATFNNISVISWRSVLLVEETGVPGENHRPVASH
jgi:hypothetical protein